MCTKDEIGDCEWCSATDVPVYDRRNIGDCPLFGVVYKVCDTCCKASNELQREVEKEYLEDLEQDMQRASFDQETHYGELERKQAEFDQRMNQQ